MVTRAMTTKRKAFTAAQRLKVFESYGAIVLCQAPGCDNAMYIKGCDIDHIQALVDEGKHKPENWRPICSSCHRKKSAREHRANSKAKRVAKAQEVHRAVVAKVMSKPPGKIKGNGFKAWRRFDGSIVRREK